MIKILRSRVPIRFLCKYFSVSKSSYYYWLKGSLSHGVTVKRSICQKIKEIFKYSRGTYGYPRVYQELKSRGILISKNTVAKYMKELELNARPKKKFRIQTTDSKHNDSIAPRLFKTEDHQTLPLKAGKVLAGDITYLKYGNKFLYLSVVLDIFNREILGWSMGESLETGLVLRAMDSAMLKVGPDAEMIFHSDRGSQYASEAYRNFLKNKKIKPSMSRKGNCYDNCYVESWFSSLKKEWIYPHRPETKGALKSLIFEYIETWYNRKRKHSSLGYLSPIEYKEQKLIA